MKPIVGLFVGDAHVMGDTGLCVPDMPVGSKDQRPYSASYKQRWLYERYQDLKQFAELLAMEYRLFVGIGGDNVDGVMHHDSTQTYGTPQDQVNMAVELFKPLVSLATFAHGVTGTASHVGDVGNDDRAVYELLGIEYSDYYQLEIGGERLLHWAHHGLPVGKRDHTEEDGAARLAKDVEIRCLRKGERVPDAIVGHDRHRSFKPFMMRDISVAVCPCFQLPTYYGMTWPHDSVDIGYLIWHFDSNRIERIIYEQPERIVKVG